MFYIHNKFLFLCTCFFNNIVIIIRAIRNNTKYKINNENDFSRLLRYLFHTYFVEILIVQDSALEVQSYGNIFYTIHESHSTLIK